MLCMVSLLSHVYSPLPPPPSIYFMSVIGSANYPSSLFISPLVEQECSMENDLGHYFEDDIHVCSKVIKPGWATTSRLRQKVKGLES